MMCVASRQTIRSETSRHSKHDKLRTAEVAAAILLQNLASSSRSPGKQLRASVSTYSENRGRCNAITILTYRPSRLRRTPVDPFPRCGRSPLKRSPPGPRDPRPSGGRARSPGPPGSPCGCSWTARTTSTHRSPFCRTSISHPETYYY